MPRALVMSPTILSALLFIYILNCRGFDVSSIVFACSLPSLDRYLILSISPYFFTKFL